MLQGEQGGKRSEVWCLEILCLEIDCVDFNLSFKIVGMEDMHLGF